MSSLTSSAFAGSLMFAGFGKVYPCFRIDNPSSFRIFFVPEVPAEKLTFATLDLPKPVFH